MSNEFYETIVEPRSIWTNNVTVMWAILNLFHAAAVFILELDFSFKSILAHCEPN